MKRDTSLKEVENLTDNLIRNARAVHMGKKIFSGNVLYYYYTIKSLMKKHYSN